VEFLEVRLRAAEGAVPAHPVDVMLKAGGGRIRRLRLS